MAHIVVLGAGIGGMPAAYELRAALDRSHRITVVNALDYFQFVPSNPWLAVGWREREAITFPIRPHLEKKGFDFIARRVKRINAVSPPSCTTSPTSWPASPPPTRAAGPRSAWPTWVTPARPSSRCRRSRRAT
jgi:NADPH-dependent 2,4-dienoyl-CoA reductase/sulfur reductase-like enzyme